MKRFAVLVPGTSRMGGIEQGIPPLLVLVAPCETWYAARHWFSLVTGIPPETLPAITQLPEDPTVVEEFLDEQIERTRASAAVWVPPVGSRCPAPAGYGRMRGVNGKPANVSLAWLNRVFRGLNGLEHLLGDG